MAESQITFEKMAANCTEYEKRLDKAFQGEACVKHLPVTLTLKRDKEEFKVILTSKIFSDKNRSGTVIGKKQGSGELINLDTFLNVPEGEQPWELSAEFNGESISLLKKIAKLTDFEEYRKEKAESYNTAASNFLGQILDTEAMSDDEKETAAKYISSCITDSKAPFLALMCCPQYSCDESFDFVPCYMVPEYCNVKDCPYKCFLKAKEQK